MDDVRWLDPAEERAWRALQFMQMRLEGALARQLVADSGLSYPDYLVLVALTDRPDGRMRLFELAARQPAGSRCDLHGADGETLGRGGGTGAWAGRAVRQGASMRRLQLHQSMRLRLSSALLLLPT